MEVHSHLSQAVLLLRHQVVIYQALKQTSKMLGRFPADHALAGQQRLVVLKVNH
jgi:hypothetical protein